MEEKILYKDSSYKLQGLFFSNRKTWFHKSVLVFIAISIVFVAIRVLPARAAELYFGFHGREIGTDKVSEIGVFLDTEGESINAIEGEVVFSEDLPLEFEEIRDGSSIISFWVKKPEVKNSAIPFSGIVPGGYNGRDGLLFSVFFESKEEGGIAVDAKNLRVLKSDPPGSSVEIRVSPLSLAVREDAATPEFPPPADILPPDPFAPEVIKSHNLFDGKWALAFSATDKGSGIDRYEVKEEKETTLFGMKLRKGEWGAAESPYLLRDQKRASTIYVKAVDKAGNERIERLPPKEQSAWYDAVPFLYPFGGAVLLALLWAGKKVVWKRSFGKKK